MKSPITREVFDPMNALHVQACKEFFTTGRWALHFELEEPEFKSLPHQVLKQYFLAHA